MAIIGVDVDLTVVASDRMWFDWCNSKCRKQLNYEEVIAAGSVPYDFGKLFGFVEPSIALDFWCDEDIYDELDPLPGVIECLHNLSRYGHEIVFVSKLMGNHFESKKRFLERFFPFMDGFIGTDQKKFARVDVLIDDRVDHLNRVQAAGIIPVQYMTPYLQDEEPAKDMAFIRSWNNLLFDDADTLYNALLTNIRKAAL